MLEWTWDSKPCSGGWPLLVFGKAQSPKGEIVVSFYQGTGILEHDSMPSAFVGKTDIPVPTTQNRAVLENAIESWLHQN